MPFLALAVAFALWAVMGTSLVVCVRRQHFEPRWNALARWVTLGMAPALVGVAVLSSLPEKGNEVFLCGALVASTCAQLAYLTALGVSVGRGSPGPWLLAASAALFAWYAIIFREGSTPPVAWGMLVYWLVVASVVARATVLSTVEPSLLLFALGGVLIGAGDLLAAVRLFRPGHYDALPALTKELLPGLFFFAGQLLLMLTVPVAQWWGRRKYQPVPLVPLEQ